MRIVTFNHHESYLCLLAELGYPIDVITSKGKLDFSWSPTARPIPENLNPISFEDAVRKISDGDYDLGILHTVMNILWFRKFPKLPCFFIAHIVLFRNSWKEKLKSKLKIAIVKNFLRPAHRRIVYISDLKHQNWGLRGTVIENVPGSVPQSSCQPGPARFIIVGNRLKERGEEVGYPLIESLKQEFDILVIGNNPGIQGAFIPRSSAEFFQAFTQGNVFVFLIGPKYNDGYNLGMLEAMKMGMPVVALENPSSPIKNAVNGFLGKNLEEIRNHLRYFMAHPQTIHPMGQAARATILSQFSLQDFCKKWRDEIEIIVASGEKK